MTWKNNLNPSAAGLFLPHVSANPQTNEPASDPGE